MNKLSFIDLRSFLEHLEKTKQLVRIECEVDPNQEITIIQHRTMALENSPALLFERVKGSPYRLVSNLFGTIKRCELAFGTAPAQLGEMFPALLERLVPPSMSNLWGSRREIRKLLRTRMRNVRSGPILENTTEPPNIETLPCLTCWPEDGGPFFTLPLVQTTDPETGVGNLGIYRLQRYDTRSTGMHWQIEKGGGFHFQRACQLGQSLPVSVALGGPPALTIAAVAPLPEGVDERLLASLMLGKPLPVIQRPSGHRIPAHAEFVLEGSVSANDTRREGPFGDHLGHYSHSADFPVFRIQRMLARNNAIYPATVVGKPPQEDYYMGIALQEMTLPLIRMMRPAVRSLWAYPESGFHPLAVASVCERYPKEALKHAFGLLGEGQLSLTKVFIVVGDQVDAKDFQQVSQAIWNHLDLSDGLFLLAPTAQDTLDFTGPAMNTGSRLILLATPKEGQLLRKSPPPPPPRASEVHPSIEALTHIGPAFLVARVNQVFDLASVRQALSDHPLTGQYLFHILVSPDVPIDDPMLVLWGWFTRFDPLADIHPQNTQTVGNRLIFEAPITIDATWKKGYRKVVAFDPTIEKMVDQRWSRYGIEGARA